MRKAAHKLITLCNQFDKTGDELCGNITSAREWDKIQDELGEKAREIEQTFRDMLGELNLILFAGDVLDFHDHYTLQKENLI